MVNIRNLNEHLQQAAKEDLGEVPERIGEDLLAFRSWIEQQPHLKANCDDQHLIAFLRGSKYSLEKAKSKLDKYYAIRTKYPQIFRPTDVNDSKFREILQLGCFLHLPIPLNDHGPRIGVSRNGAYDPNRFKPDELFAVASALQEILLIEDDYAVIYGVVHIVDLTDSTMQHLLQVTPSLMKKLSTYSEEAVPLRNKATHFLNGPTGFHSFFHMLKPLLSSKQQNRLFVHGNDFKSLTEHIPLKYLPKDYGGENGTFAEIIADTIKKIDQYAEYFKSNDQFGSNEQLRIGNAIDFDSIFGVDGSFRTLNVD